MEAAAVVDGRVVRGVRRVAVPALIAGLVGVIGFVIAAITTPDVAFLGYLAAYVFALTIALGALCLIMIGHVTHAKWIIVVRRVAEAIAGTIPAFVVLFIPILVGLQRLYPWVPPLDDLTPKLRDNILKKAAYLNVPFFLVRAAIYFAVWAGLAFLLRRWSFQQDRDPDAAPVERPVKLSAAGLMLFGVTITWATIDWLMALSPDWESTVFGAYVFAGAMVGGLSLMAILVFLLERSGALRDVVAASHYYALGRLMLVFVIFWAYMAYSQGFLIWIANLPSEVPYYIARTLTGWGWAFGALVIGHFALPFLALLMYRLKRRGKSLALIGAWLLLMHYVDVAWLVLPALHAGSVGPHWSDAASLLAVCGLAIAFGAWRMAGVAIVPRNDPRLAKSLEYDSR